MRQHRAQHRHAGAATPLFVGDLSKTAAHYVSLFYDCRPELLDVKVGQLAERDLALLLRVGTHHAEPLEIWRLIQSNADLRGVATLLLTSRCLCTLCGAMVDRLATSGAMRISARHDEEMLQPVLQLLARHTSVAGLGVKRPPKETKGPRRTLARLLAALAAAEADLLTVRGARELDQELTSVSTALRRHNAAVRQMEAGEGAGGADQPPLPKGRSRSSEVSGDKEKVHAGSTTVGDEWRQAEDNRAKQVVRACDNCAKQLVHCARVSLCLCHVCCLARRSAPRAWPRVRGGGCRSGGRRSAGRRGRGRGRKERRGGPAPVVQKHRTTCRNTGQRAGRTATATPNTLAPPNATRNAPSIQQSSYSSARPTEYIEQARSGQRNR
eukprot:COSAG01_NODE_4563_length_4918_cov_6.841701_4_plen_383_part_00